MNESMHHLRFTLEELVAEICRDVKLEVRRVPPLCLATIQPVYQTNRRYDVQVNRHVPVSLDINVSNSKNIKSEVFQSCNMPKAVLYSTSKGKPKASFCFFYQKLRALNGH